MSKNEKVYAYRTGLSALSTLEAQSIPISYSDLKKKTGIKTMGGLKVFIKQLRKRGLLKGSNQNLFLTTPMRREQ